MLEKIIKKLSLSKISLSYQEKKSGLLEVLKISALYLTASAVLAVASPYTTKKVGAEPCVSNYSTEEALPYELLEGSGDPRNRTVVVIGSEGYTQEELDSGKFRQDALEIVRASFSKEPMNEFADFMMFYALYAPSNESGADHPSEGIEVDTRYDADYLRSSINVNTQTVLSDIENSLGHLGIDPYDYMRVLAHIIVNDPKLGYQAGVEINPSATNNKGTLGTPITDLWIHEGIGHGKNLQDQYIVYPGHPFPSKNWLPKVNCFGSLDDPALVAWSDLLDPQCGCTYDCVGQDEVYSPTFNCIMGLGGEEFCPICTEFLVSEYGRLTGIDDVWPAEEIIATTQPVKFRAKTAEPKGEHSTSVKKWYVNGKLAGKGDEFDYNGPEGTNTVKFVWEIDTHWVRQEKYKKKLKNEHSWTILYQQFNWPKGDVNCDLRITPEDAQLTLMDFLQKIQLGHNPCDQKKAADWDKDNSVTPEDALSILRHYLRME